jgi:hypothetical protein
MEKSCHLATLGRITEKCILILPKVLIFLFLFSVAVGGLVVSVLAIHPRLVGSRVQTRSRKINVLRVIKILLRRQSAAAGPV